MPDLDEAQDSFPFSPEGQYLGHLLVSGDVGGPESGLWAGSTRPSTDYSRLRSAVREPARIFDRRRYDP